MHHVSSCNFTLLLTMLQSSPLKAERPEQPSLWV